MFPQQLYTSQQCRELDSQVIKDGTPGYSLMCRAGAAAFDLLLQFWPLLGHTDNACVHVVCGAGNNGGDGLVLARLAHEQSLPVTVHFLGEKEKLHGEALAAWRDAEVAGVAIVPVDVATSLTDGVVVDALLGIGLQGNVRENAAMVIDWMNASQLPILALDVPSGICSDTGKVLGKAVKADKTITFIAAKRGLYTGEAVEYTGDILLDDLDVPARYFSQAGETVEVLQRENLRSLLPQRTRNAHKGKFGHVLIVGGNEGMAGAALMAAIAAARSGAGLVSVATIPAHVSAMVSRQPEIMAHGVMNVHDLKPLLERASVVVVGPGLGRSPWAEQMLYQACSSGLPLVLDADALNLLAQNRVIQPPFPETWILTPHPGEAARLLGNTTENINEDRFAAAMQLREKYAATVVLKGAGSIIACGKGLALCPYGNPGMASGGMGDVLSGVLGGLLAQGLSISDAAGLGVTVHACAADKLALEYGERGLLATDLVPVVRQLLN